MPSRNIAVDSRKLRMGERVGYGLLIAILAIGNVLVYAPAGSAEKSGATFELSEFPMTLGDWSGTEMAISDDALAILGASDYLMRVYSRGGRDLTLYITCFNSGNGALTHNPEKCYTGSGWTFLDKRTVKLPKTDQRVLQSTVLRADKRQALVYWYQDRDRVIVSKWDHVGTVLSGAMLGRGTQSLVASVAETIPDGGEIDNAEVRLDFSGQAIEALAQLVSQ